MSIELNSQQVIFIEENLSSKGMEYDPLKEELLDHLCCMVENKMKSGKSFHIASNEVFDAFGKEELKELQNRTFKLLNQRKLTLRKALALGFGLLFTICALLWIFNDEPPSSNPLGDDYEITSDFGMRMHPIYKKNKMHSGIDFKAPIGTPVYATSDGEIIKVEYQVGGYGKFIIIKHDNIYQTLYSQLSEIKVEVGQKVEQGDEIGLVGSSGASTAPHLHYEVMRDGQKVNPKDYFRP